MSSGAALSYQQPPQSYRPDDGGSDKKKRHDDCTRCEPPAVALYSTGRNGLMVVVLGCRGLQRFDEVAWGEVWWRAWVAVLVHGCAGRRKPGRCSPSGKKPSREATSHSTALKQRTEAVQAPTPCRGMDLSRQVPTNTHAHIHTASTWHQARNYTAAQAIRSPTSTCRTYKLFFSRNRCGRFTRRDDHHPASHGRKICMSLARMRSIDRHVFG
jgi:hypothetical protein